MTGCIQPKFPGISKTLTYRRKDSQEKKTLTAALTSQMSRINQAMNIPSANMTVRVSNAGRADHACTCFRKGFSQALWICRSTLALYTIARQLDDLAYYQNNTGRSGLSQEWILSTWMMYEGKCGMCRNVMDLPVACAAHTINEDRCVTITRYNLEAPNSRLNTILVCMSCRNGGRPTTAVFTPFD